MTNTAEIIIFVGDVTEYLAKKALDFDKNARLITSSNSLNLDAGVYYCSIGDLSGLNEFSYILRQATTIHYSPPPNNVWSDKKIKEWTEDYLISFSCDYEKSVLNFEKPQISVKNNMLDLPDTRRSKNPQIWIVGCSGSHAVGVLPNERYGHLFAEHLKMPVSFLTKSGSSIRWAADQILRSDIRSNDIVLWGLTTCPRITYWNGVTNEVECCNPSTFDQNYAKKYIRKLIKRNYFASRIPIFDSLQAIDAVDNVMKNKNVKFLKGIIANSELQQYLEPEENLLVLSGIYGRNLEDLWIDIGSDGKHPGPKTHKMFYEKFLERYYKLYS